MEPDYKAPLSMRSFHDEVSLYQKELEMPILNYYKSKERTQKPKQRFDLVKGRRGGNNDSDVCSLELFLHCIPRWRLNACIL
jgi:hypothetical protein